MKFKFKRLLALLMAIMLAIPSFAFAEDAELVLDVDTGSDVVAEDLDLDIEVDAPGELAQEEPTLELGGELQNGDLLEGEAAIEAPAQAFEQTLEYDGLRFTVKADAGVVGEGAVLSVTGLNYADEVAEAAKAIGVDGIHKAYGIYLTGAPYEAGKPVVRVEGAAGVVSVVSYGFDKAANAVEAKIDGEAVEFALADVQAYDLVFAAIAEETPAEEAVSTIEEAAPAAEEEEVVIEEAPAGEAADDDGIVLEETSEEASEEEEEIVIEEAPAEEAAPADEGIVLGEEEEKAPAEEIVIDEVPADEAAAEETPVEENAEEVFVIGNYPAFTKSAKVEGTNVRVNVTAPEGAFPEGAKLSVTEVVAEEDLAQVDAAVEAERGDMANIAKSYTLDIKVVDAEGNELQPANGQVVTVTFVADEVSDAELTTEVYHVSDDGQAEALDVSEKGRRATVETEGFSVYCLVFFETTNQGYYTLSLNVGDKVSVSDVLGNSGHDANAVITKVTSSVPASLEVSGDAVSGFMLEAKQSDLVTLEIEGHAPSTTTPFAITLRVEIAFGDYVAQIGETKYVTLAQAIDVANRHYSAPMTITLLSDCETGSAYTIGNPLSLKNNGATLDLDGKTITVTNNFSFLIEGHNVKVKNGVIIAGSNGDKACGYNSYALVVNNCDGVTLQGLTVKGGISAGGSTGETPTPAAATNMVIENCTVTGGDYYAVCAQQTGSVVTIKSGAYNSSGAQNYSAVLHATFVGTDGPRGKIVVEGGIFTGKINANDEGDIVLKGGTFTVRPDDKYVADGYTVVQDSSNYVVTKLGDPDIEPAPAGSNYDYTIQQQLPDGTNVGDATKVSVVYENIEEGGVDIRKILSNIASEVTPGTAEIEVHVGVSATPLTQNNDSYDVSLFASVDGNTLVKLGNDCLSSSASFELVLPAPSGTKADDTVRVTHKSANYPTETFTVTAVAVGSYIVVPLTITHFSTIDLTTLDPNDGYIVNTVTGHQYESLAQAVQDANGNTLALLAEIPADDKFEHLNRGQTIAINPNGKMASDAITSHLFANDDGYIVVCDSDPDNDGVYIYSVERDATAELEVTVEPDSYIYDGNTKTPNVTVTIDGAKLNPSEYSVVYADNKDAGTAIVTVTYDADVVTPARTGTATFTIAPRPVTIKANDVNVKEGTPKAEVVFKHTAFNLVNPADVDPNRPAVICEYEGTEPAGTELPIYFSSNAAAGMNRLYPNYTFTLESGTLTVVDASKHVVTASIDRDTFTYGETGDDEPVITVMEGDDVLDTGYTVKYAGIKGTEHTNPTVVPTNVGTYMAMVEMTNKTDYIISGDSNFEFRILPAQVTVTPTAATKTYGENDPAAFTYTIDPDDVTVSGELSRVAGEDVGDYAFTLGDLSAGDNYELKLATGATVAQFTIEPKDLTVTAEDKTVDYGTAPVFTSTFNPTVDEDEVKVTYTVQDNSGTAWDGFSAGIYTIIPAATNANYNITPVNGTLTVNAKAVTVTAKDASKVYDDAEPTAFEATVEGLVGSDTIEYTVSRVAGQDVGEYAITPAGEATQGNYTVTYVPGTFTITAKPITVTVQDAEKVYGKADPAPAVAILPDGYTPPSGLVVPTREAGENVGQYKRTVTVADNKNFVVTVIDGTLTITPATLTVTWPAEDSYAYGYGTEGGEGPRATVAGLVGEDKAETVVDADQNAGANKVATVVITPNPDNYTLADGSTLTKTYEIRRRPLGVTVNPNAVVTKTKIYDGTTDASDLIDASGITYSNFGRVNGTRDTASDVFAVVTDASFADADAATGKDLNLTLELRGPKANNYTFSDGTLVKTFGLKGTIRQKDVTVKAENYTITYGDSLVDGVLTGTVTGTVGNDSIDVTYALDPAFPYPDKGAGYYTIVPTVEEDNYPNYDITTENGILTVDRADLNIEAPSMTINVGDEMPVLAELKVKMEGLKGSDTEDVIGYSLSCTATDSVTPGVYAITVTPAIAAIGNRNGSYDIHTVSGLLIIQDSDAAYTVEFATAPDETYDTTEHEPAVVVKYNDKVLEAGRDYTLNYTDNVNAGTATVTVSPMASSTYTSFKEHVLQFVIKPAALTVTANAQGKVYGEDDAAKFVPTAYTTDPANVTLEGELTREPGEDAGTYAIQQGTLKNDNYDITFTGADFTISKKALTVTPTANTKVYGAADPVLAYVAEGEVEGDGLTYQVTRDAGENAGSYNMFVTVSGSKLKNYNVTTETGTFTITKASLTFKANDAEMTYGDTKLPTFTTEVTGLVNGDVVNPSDLFYSPDDVATAVDGMAIHPSLTQVAYDRLKDNYEFGTVTDGTLTVNKAELIVMADDQAIMVGQDTPELTMTVIGLKGSDDADTVLKDVELKVDTNESEPLPAGTYAIVEASATPVELTNYTYSFVPGTLTVSVKPIALVKAVDDEFIYNAEAQAPAITVETGNGTLDEDDFTVSYAGTKANNEAYASTEKPVDAGSYTATVALADSIKDYYWLGGQTVIPFEIKQKPVTATWTYDEKTYDGKPVDVAVLPKASAVDPYSPGNALEITHKYDPETVLNAGEYTATAILDDLAYNYVLTEETETYTFRVKPASLTVTVDEEQSKVYGSPNPVLTYTVDGLVNGEKEEDVMSGALTRLAGEGVGDYSILQGSLSAGTNYDITFNDDVFTIEKKNVNVAAIDKTITYGDTFDPATDLQIAVEGLIGNDEPEISFTVKNGDTAFDGKAGTYTITPNVVFTDAKVAANYDINTVDGTLTVKKAMLTIKADDQSILVGEDTPAATDLTKTVLSGLQDPDTESIADNITLKIDTNLTGKLPAGNYPIVEGDTPVTLDNYDYVVLPGTLYVTAKPAAYASATNTVQTYGSVTAPTVKLTNTAGDELDDKYFAVTYSGIVADGSEYTEQTYVPEHAGKYIIKVALTDEGAAEYSLVGQSEFDFIINPASLPVTWGGIDNLVYDGQVKTITATYEMPDATEPSNAAVTPEVKDAGRYTLIASFKATNVYDYELTDNIRIIDVAKADLTITPTADQSKVYGSVDPVLTYDTPVLLGANDAITGMLSREAGEDVTDEGYAITIGSLSAGDNYNITVADAKFSIVAKEVTVTADDKTISYDEAPEFTSTVVGLIGNDKLEINYTTDPTFTGKPDAGTYAIKPSAVPATGVNAKNYDIKPVDGTLTVVPMAVTVRWTGKLVYVEGEITDANAPAVDTEAAKIGAPKYYKLGETTALTAVPTEVGNYQARFELNEGVKADNYDLRNVDFDFSIVDKLDTVSVAAIDDVTYDGKAHEPALTVTINGEAATLTTDYTVEYANNVDAGTASATVFPTDKYHFNPVTVYFNILPMDVTVTVDNATKVYGDPDPSFTATLDPATVDGKDISLSFAFYRDAGEDVSEDYGYQVIAYGAQFQGNYKVLYVAGKMTITKANATVKADDIHVTYGDRYVLTATVTGAKNGDKLNYTLDTSGDNAGEFDITVTVGDNDNPNYNVTAQNGKLYIEKAPLVVIADDQAIEFGANRPTDLTKRVTGLKGNDKADVADGITLKVDTAKNDPLPVGVYSIVEASANPVELTNYTYTFVPGKLIVTEKPLAMAKAGETEFTYNSQEQAPEITVEIGGVAQSDFTVTYTGKNAAGTDYSNTTKPTDAGTYTATVALGDSLKDIYWLAGQTVVPFEIKQKPVDFEWKDYTTGPTYTGTNIAEGLMPTGEATNEFTGQKLSTTVEYADQPIINAGKYTAIAKLDATAYNFVLTEETKTKTFEVLPATLKITADTNQSKVYGSPNPVLTYTFDEDQLLGDDDEITGELSREPGEDAGTYKILLGSLTAGSNYDIDFIDADFTIDKKNVTVTANDKTITYGEEYAPATQSTSTVDGLIGNDEVEITYTVAATYSGNAGTYTVTPAANVTVGKADNYNITAVPGTLTVNKADVEIHVNDVEITYGDEITEAMMTATELYKVDGDELKYTVGEDLVGEKLDVNEYEIKVVPDAADATNKNYNIHVVPGVLTVRKKIVHVKVTMSTPTGVYTPEGSVAPAIGYDYDPKPYEDYGAPIALDTVFYGTVVGKQDIAVDADVYTVVTTINESASPKYNPDNVEYVFSSPTYTVTPREINVTVKNAEKFETHADPIFTIEIDDGDFLTEKDNVKDAVKQSIQNSVTFRREPGETAGAYAIHLAGANTGNRNYVVKEKAAGTLTIKALPTDFSVAWDGEPYSTTYNGEKQVPGKDNFTVKVEGQEITDFEIVEEPGDDYINAGKHAVYIHSNVEGWNWDGIPMYFEILPRELNVSSISLENNQKDYDGNADATDLLSNVVITYNAGDVVQGDKVGAVIKSASFDNENVGDNKDITAYFSDELTGEDADNYKLVTTELIVNRIGVINAIPLTVTANDQTFVYGETIPATFEGYTIEGLVATDKETVSLTRVGSATDVGVYDEDINAEVTSIVDKDDATKDHIGNYTINSPIKGTLTITKAPAKIFAHDLEVTYGTAITDAMLTATVIGEVKPGEIVFELNGVFKKSPDLTDAGEYVIDIVPDADCAKNYDFELVPGKLTVIKQPVDVEWTGNLVYAYTGSAIENDKLPKVADADIAKLGNVSFTDAAGAAVTEVKNVGTYKAVFTPTDTKNYDFRNTVFTFAVDRKALSIDVDWKIPASTMYDGKPFNETKGIVPVLTDADTQEFIDPSEYKVIYGENLNAGKATITIINKEGGVYSIPEMVKEFEITKRLLVITPTADQYKYYGQPDEEFKWEVTGGDGYAEGEGKENIEGKLGRDPGEDAKVPGTAMDVTYHFSVVQMNLLTTNYEFRLARDDTFKILPATLKIIPSDVSYVYGDAEAEADFKQKLADGTLAVTYDETFYGDKPSGLVVVKEKADEYNAGTYELSVDTTKLVIKNAKGTDISGNYIFDDSVTGTLTITPDVIVDVDWQEGDYYYDGNAKQPAVVAMTTATGRVVEDTDYTVTYSDNPVEPGNYVATATLTTEAAKNYVYNPADFTLNFSIFAAGTAVEVTWPTDREDDYDGTVHEFAPTAVKFGNTPLDKDTDYTVIISGELKNAGEYTATVELTEQALKRYNYVMNASTTYTINPVEVTVYTKDATKYVSTADPRLEINVDTIDTSNVPDAEKQAVVDAIKETAVLTRQVGEDIGTYDIYLAYANAGDNYKVVAGNGGKLTIKELPGDCKVEWAHGEPDFVYDGNVHIPTKSDFKVTMEGEEIPFSLVYDDKDSTDAGKYKVWVFSTASGFNWDQPMIYEIKKAPVSAVLDSDVENVNFKRYDGNDDAYDIVKDYMIFNGIVSGEDVEVEFDARFDDKNVGDRKVITVTLGDLTGEDARNYYVNQIDELKVNNSQITEATLVITANPQTKVYDNVDATDPELTYVITLDGNEVEALYGDDEITGSLDREGDQNVGEYAIIQNGLAVDDGNGGQNYTLSFETANFTITKRPVTVTGIRAVDKVYDGSPEAEMNTTDVTFNGLVAGDVLTLTVTGLFDDKNVGTHKTVAITYGAEALGGGSKGNYEFLADDSQSNAYANITPRQVDVSGIVVADKNYDGTTTVADAQISGPTIGNKVDTDDLTANVTGVYENKYAGTGKTVILDIILAGNDAGNYVLAATTQKTATSAINTIPLTVTGITAQDKPYDGGIDAKLNVDGAGLDGKLGNDVVTLNVDNAKGIFDGKDAGDHTVTVSGLWLDGVDARNYTLSECTTPAKIDKKTLKVVNLHAEDRVYDSTTDAVITAALEGVVSGEDVSIKADTLKGAFNSAHVAEADHVYITSIELDGEADVLANYQLDDTQWSALTADANITKFVIDVANVPIQVADKDYDAKTTADMQEAEITEGTVYVDSHYEELRATGTATFMTKDAGLNKDVLITHLTLLDGEDNNRKGLASDYDLTTRTTTATANINKYQIHISGVKAEDKQYDGTAVAELDVSEAEFVTPPLSIEVVTDEGTITVTDEVTIESGTGTFDGEDVKPKRNVTNPIIVLGGADGHNYEPIVDDSLKADITPCLVKVEGFAAQSKDYDGSEHADLVDYEITDLLLVAVLEDRQAVLDGDIADYSLALDDSEIDANFDNEDVGTDKPVTITGLKLTSNPASIASNYEIVPPVVYANINQLDAQIIEVQGEPAVIDKVYDGNNIAYLDVDKLVLVLPAGQYAQDDDVHIASDGYIARYADVNADDGEGEGIDVTIANLRLTGDDAYKYKLDDTDVYVVKGHILKKEVKIVGVAVADKEYNGKADDATSYVKLRDAKVVGTIGNDVVNVANTKSAIYDNPNAGTNKMVTVTDLGLAGEADVLKNYKLPQDYSLRLTGVITPKTVIANGIEVTVKDYDGTTDATLGEATINGKVDGDDLSVTATGKFSDKNADEDKLVTLELTLAGAAKDNYVLSNQSQTTARGTINPVAVNISGITAENKIYDGNDNATLNWSNATFETKKLATDDLFVANAKGKFSDANADDGKTVTIKRTDVVLAGKDANNYKVGTVATATADITKATVYVFPEDATKAYLDNDPVFKYHVSGLKANEPLSVISGDLSRDSGDGVGTYAISTDGLVANNYDIVKGNNAALTIISRRVEPKITVTTPVDQIVYNGKEWKPAVEVEDDLGNVIPSNEYELVYSNNFDAGTATVTVKDVNGRNYDLHMDSVNFTIRKAPLTVKPNKVYWTWSYNWVEPNWDNPEASWWTATPGVVDPTNEKIAVQLQRNSKVTNVKDTPVKNDVSVKKVTITRNGRDITANYDINATAKADFEILPLSVIPTIQLTGMDYGNDPAWKVGKDRGFDYTGKELKPVVTLLDADGNVIPYSTGKDSEYKWEVKTIFDNKPIEPRDSNSFKIVITDDNPKGNYNIDTTKVIDADHSQYKIYPKLVTLRWDPDTLVLGYNGFQQTPTAIVNEFPDVKVSVKVIGGDGINVKNNPHTAEAWGFEEDQPNLKFPKNHPVTQYTITKATLTIKPNASKLTKVYGTKDGDMPYTYTGLKGDDAQKVKVVGNLHRANGEHAGNYAIDTSLIDVVSQFDGAPTGNYNIVLDKPYNFVITRRPLEVAWSNGDIEMSAEGWALDANYALYRLFENRQMKPDNLVIVDKTIDSSVVSQKVDLNEYDFDWSDMYSFDAGTYTFKVVDRAGGDFDITCPRSMKYRIDPVTVSLTWKDHMVYNGKEQKPEVTVTVNEGSFSKVKLIADVQVVTQPSQDVNLPTGASEADAKPKYKAFVKQLLDNGSEPKMDQNTIDNNFKFDKTEHEFYITPAGLTVTADNLTKIYRDPDPQLTYTVTGLLGEDTAETVVTGNLVREAGEEVGVYGVFDGYTDENGTWIRTLSANKNYDMTFVPGTLTILEKPVTVENVNVQILDVPRTYNGKEHKPEVIVTVDDVVIPSNEYTVTYENNLDAGTASIYLADIPGGNYDLTFDMKPTLNFDIRPRTVTLKWSKLEFQYDGKRHVPTCKVEGLIPGDTCRASVSYSDKPVNAGTYTAFAVDLSNKNYKLPKNNSTKFVIKPIKEKIPVDGVVLSKTTYTYNGKEKTPIVTVYADGVVIPKSEYKVTYKNNIHAGTAQVIIRNVPGNYDLDFETKSYDFTILQRTAELVWSNLNFVYDGKAHKPTATVGNLVKGDTCKVTVRVIEELVSNAKYITAKEIGGYVAQAIKLSNKDYKLPEETTTEFYIAPRKVSGNLILTMKRRTNLDSLKLKWTKVQGVDGYDIFMSRCTNEYVHYLPELVQTIDNNSTFTWYANELKPGICYKALVKAFILVDGKKEYVRTSLKAHCVTYGPSKYTNSTELKVNKDKVTLKKGKTFQIKATTVKEAPSKKYVPHEAEVRYFSTDTNVATVSSDGKITAVGAGFCRIYVETLNGIYKAVKVTVK